MERYCFGLCWVDKSIKTKQNTTDDDMALMDGWNGMDGRESWSSFFLPPLAVVVLSTRNKQTHISGFNQNVAGYFREKGENCSLRRAGRIHTRHKLP